MLKAKDGLSPLSPNVRTWLFPQSLSQTEETQHLIPVYQARQDLDSGTWLLLQKLDPSPALRIQPAAEPVPLCVDFSDCILMSHSLYSGACVRDG